LYWELTFGSRLLGRHSTASPPFQSL
jgi:hypothetical protein